MRKNRIFLEWAERKYPLLDDIKRHLPQGGCLIEPFVGAGSVFLNTGFSRYILTNINSDLINLYSVARARISEYVQASRELFMPETNQAEVYYRFKEESNASEGPLRKVVLPLHLSRFGYDGLCRYNLRDEFSIPFRRYKKPHFPEAELYHFAEKAQNAESHCLSYEECMGCVDSGSMVYRDPSYAPLLAAANFAAYHTNSLSSEGQAHLAEMTERLVSKQIPVLVSNHDTSDTHE